MAADLYLVDVATGRVQALVEQPGFDLEPFWSPDGKKIAFKTLAGKIDWQYSSQIGIVDLSSATPRVTFPMAATPEDPRTRWTDLGGWSRDGEEFYYVSPVRGHNEAHALNVKTGAIRRLSVQPTAKIDDWITGWLTARDSGDVVFQSGDFNHMPDLYVWHGKKNYFARRMSNLNPIINDHPYAHVESLTWPSADGKWQLQGFLLTPMNSKGRLPLIVDVVGGPTMAWAGDVMIRDLTSFPWPSFVNHGYAIFMPNTRGRRGFGNAFINAFEADHSMNRVPATDVVAGVESLVRRGLVDPQRLGIAGHSYGGGVAAYALSLSKLFRAASIHEANALNPWDHYSASPISMYWAHVYGGTSPFDPAIWPLVLRDSPSDAASSVTTPVLLGFGIETFAQTQGRPYYEALQHYHIPSEFIVYPRSGHNTVEPVLVADGYRRNLEWFDYWVMGIASDEMRRRYGSPTVPEFHPTR
jgi:dipeptidyl aminopeptidase/acylaminoacyl peptidase